MKITNDGCRTSPDRRAVLDEPGALFRPATAWSARTPQLGHAIGFGYPKASRNWAAAACLVSSAIQSPARGSPPSSASATGASTGPRS
jgi:hypothetical protein